MSDLTNLKIDKNIYTDQELFEIENFVTSSNFPWYYQKHQVEDRKDDPFFSHNFYLDYNFCSPYEKFIEPLLKFIKPTAILNIRMNFLISKKDHYYSAFHTDGFNNQTKHTTSIFYLNTNNGYTELEDGTKISSEKNKLVSFPAFLRHRACSATDKSYRIVINFNYFK